MIELIDLEKAYQTKSKTKVYAIKKISLKFDDNGLVFVVGKSGSGKSTLLNLIGALDTFDHGEILIDNQPISNLKSDELDNYRNYDVGFVFQEYNLLENYTVYKNIELVLDLQNVENKEEKIDEVLKQVELEDFKHRHIHELSGGQKQRVAIARALVKNPKVILCDEPTGSLDSETGKTIFELLEKISKNTLVIVVTHDINSAYKFGNRIIRLKDGEVISDEALKNVDKIDKNINSNREHSKKRLSNKNKAKLGIYYSTKKPIRLSIALVLMVVCAIFATLTFNILTINENNALLNSMLKQENNPNYYVFHKEILESKKSDSVKKNMSEEDVTKISKLINLPTITEVYEAPPELSKDNSGISSTTTDYKIFVGGIAEINEKMVNDYHFSYVGNLPQSDDEYMITDFFATIYLKYGILVTDSNSNQSSLVKINSKNELIGLTTNSFTITGILDTKFDYSKYQPLANTDHMNYSEAESIKRDVLGEEFNNIMNGGLHNIYYVRKGFYDNQIKPNFASLLDPSNVPIGSFAYEDEIGFDNSIIINYMNSEYETLASGEANHFTVIDPSVDIIYYKDKNNPSVNGKKIFIPLSMFNFYETHYEDLLNLVYGFVNETFDDNIRNSLKSMFNPDATDDELKHSYAQYIIYNTYGMNNNSPSLDNVIQNGYTAYYFEQFIIEDFLENELDFYNPDNKYIVTKSFFELYSGIFEFGGVVYTTIGDRNVNKLFYSEELFNKYYPIVVKEYDTIKFVTAPATKNSFEIRKRVLLYKKNTNDKRTDLFGKNYNYTKYVLTNELSFGISYYAILVKSSYLISFSIICSVALLFSLIFLIYYFVGTIYDNKKEFKILRALGLSRGDIWGMFAYGLLFLGGAITLVSSLISFIIQCVINNRSNVFKYSLTSTVFNYHIYTLLFTLVFVIGLLFICVFFPLQNTLKEKKNNILSNKN